MNDGPTAADRPGSDAAAGPATGLADDLRRAVEARGASAAAGPGPGVAAIADLAAARRRRRIAGRVLLAAAASVVVLAGAVAGWRMLGGEPGGDVLVVAAPADRDDGEQDEDAAASDAAGNTASAPTAAAPTASAPTVEAPTAAVPDSSAASVEAAGAVDESPSSVSPQELSTGPALDWTEVQTGLWDLWGLQSLGDGRVLAYASRNEAQPPQIDAQERTVVTSDGVEWSEVVLPDGVTAYHVAVSGDVWVVAGFDRPSLRSTPVAGAASRAFVSKDGAATWTELEFDIAPGPAPVSPWVEHRTVVVSTLVSGQDIVLALRVSADLDVEGLVEARGLLPEDRSAAGWALSGWGFDDDADDGEVTVFLTGSALMEQAEPATTEAGDLAAVLAGSGEEGGARAAPAPPEEGDRASDVGADDPQAGIDGAWSVEEDYASGFPTGETLQFSFEELGLTVEEQDALFGEPGSLLLVWSDGDTVGEPVEAPGTGDAIGMQGAATADGFVLHLVGLSQGSMLTSPDGRTWTEHPYDTFGLYGAVVHRSSVWAAVDESSGTSLKRAALGDEPQTVARFEGLLTLELHAGPAGLAATAAPRPPTGATDGSDLGALMPDVRISRDGYELRYNDPPGGVTLWDLGAGEAVRVFEANELVGDEPVTGVRETADESGMWVTFIDPGTGEDLVTFEPEDFEAVFDALTSEGIVAPGVDVPLESGSGSVRQDEWDEWVGWSSDGLSWGWQTMTDAFGVGAGEAWLELGVGDDFVVAAVQSLGTPPVPAPDGSGALVAVPQAVRVFTAPAP